jgi:hypothetical protein
MNVSTSVSSHQSLQKMMCLTTMRGWPSEAYFVEGKFSHPVESSRKVATQTDEEES